MNSNDSILKKIKTSIQKKDRYIHLSGDYKLTKTQTAFCNVVLERDLELEASCLKYINQVENLESLLNRYNKYDPSIKITELPPHFPMKVVCGIGPIGSGSNIFLFFPYVLGISPSHFDDCFGFELINIWKNIFHKTIIPCVQSVFDLPSQLYFYENLYSRLEQTIYLASLFHEIGHQVGPWKISPTKNKSIKIEGFELDIVGELSTDSLLIKNLIHFPEIAIFVILQRLFWFGRLGFKNNPIEGDCNSDNDTWVGSYLWNKLITAQIITQNPDQTYHFSPDNIENLFTQIINEIDQLQTLSQDNQINNVKTWMQNNVTFKNNRYLISENLQKLFFKCQHVEEIPHFSPLFNYENLTQIQEKLVCNQ